MNHIWHVRIEFQENIHGEVIEDSLTFNVEAADDVEARKKGIKLAKQKSNESFQIIYAEIEHVLEIDE